jgi:hypothetical protein
MKVNSMIGHHLASKVHSKASYLYVLKFFVVTMSLLVGSQAAVGDVRIICTRLLSKVLPSELKVTSPGITYCVADYIKSIAKVQTFRFFCAGCVILLCYSG